MKWAWSWKPAVAATVATGSPVSRRLRANSMRRAITYRCGAIPNDRVNARESVEVEAPIVAAASLSRYGSAEVRVQQIAEGPRDLGIGATPAIGRRLAEVTMELFGDQAHQRLGLERIVGLTQ